MRWKVGILLFVTLTDLLLVYSRNEIVQHHLDLALKTFEEHNLVESIRLLKIALAEDPNDVDVNGALGSILLLDSNIRDGVKYLERSLEFGGISNPENVANLLHGLLLVGDFSRGLNLFEKVISIYPSNHRIIFNGLLLYYSRGDFERLYEFINSHLPDIPTLWAELMNQMTEKRYYDISEYLGRIYLNKFSDNFEIMFEFAVSLHFQNKHMEALHMYEKLAALQPNNSLVITNIGALYQAIGNNDEATNYYRKTFDKMRDDAGFLNNFGILLLHSSKDEDIADGVEMLEQALEINPNLENALVNLASYYLDESRISESAVLYQRALNLSDSRKMIEIRMATLMSPVVSSWDQMVAERNSMIVNLKMLIEQGRPHDSQYKELDPIMDRIHFYIVYSGFNDRHIQESISTIYGLFIRNLTKVSSYLLQNSYSMYIPMLSSPISPIRVGFLSKYFGVYEPHGLLLEGIMKYLPRSMFEVVTVTTRPNQGKFLSPVVSKSSDQVIFIPLIHELAFQQLADLKLDVLIFADTLSESLTHFLAQTRIAPVQIAFWGNPVTSGSHTVDYFISSEFMEHPYRSRLPDEDEPYVEQVVLLPGQGIWYSSPTSASSREVVQYLNLTIDPHEEQFRRVDFGLSDDWFIFFCPQSLFKLHPSFDHVLASILHKSPKSHLVLITGRKKRWTSIFLDRISHSLHSISNRCHIIERITSQKFFGLIKLADVLLHPFPFDGSRTSADSLSVGIPFVTLPSEYLRGRMGASFLRTMNIPELVAHNVSEYIEISVRLSVEPAFYTYIRTLIQSRSWLIWEDMLCPYSWTNFLALLCGFQPLSWEDYIGSFNLSVTKESKYRSIRDSNQRTFDLRWGRELWLLGDLGYPRLLDTVRENELLPIFNNWKYVSVNKEEEKFRLLQTAHEYALKGNFEAAFNTESMAIRYSENDAQVFLELGIYQYFRGLYQSALELCEESARLLLQQGRESSQIYGCIGVSGIYVLDQKSIHFLHKALLLHGNTTDVSPIFSFPLKSIQKSLATGLRTFKRYKECVDFLSSIFHLPLLSEVGSLIIFLSVYEMAPAIIDSISRKRSWKASGIIEYDIVMEINRIQIEFGDLIEIARDSLLNLLKSDIEQYDALYLAYHYVNEMVLNISKNRTDQNRNFSSQIIIATQYYVPNSMLTHDIDTTLLKNLANPYISDIYLLNEQYYSMVNFPYQHKLHQIVLGRRPTFQDFFDYANKHLQNKVIVIANSDIFFDESLGMFLRDVDTIDFDNTILALSKWIDWKVENDFISLFPRVDSQDAWVFRTPLSDNLVNLTPFYLGAPRCDNRIASIFTSFGYRVHNPSFRIHAIELSSNTRDGGLYDMSGAASGDTNNVFLTINFP